MDDSTQGNAPGEYKPNPSGGTLRPRARTLRKRASTVLILVCGSIFAFALGLYLASLNDKETDCRTLQQQGNIVIVCTNYLEENNSATDECYQFCQEVVWCDRAKQTNRKTDLEAYLDVYQGQTDSTCYREATDRLACLEARAAQNMDAYRDYLKTYKSGLCRAEFIEILACNDLEQKPNCRIALDYIDRYGQDGKCRQRVLDFLIDNSCILVPGDSRPCDWLTELECTELTKMYMNSLITTNCLDTVEATMEASCGGCAAAVAAMDCQQLAAYQERYGEAGRCYAAVTKRYREKCEKPPPLPPPPPPDGAEAVKIGGLWVMRNNEARWSKDFVPTAANYKAQYGRLYNWQEARNVCQGGWRLPCEQEIIYFLKYYGDGKNAYDFLTGTANNLVNIQMGGWANSQNELRDVGVSGYYWCSTEADDYKGWAVKFDAQRKSVQLVPMDKKMKLSCRCVKEAKSYRESPFLKELNCYRPLEN